MFIRDVIGPVLTSRLEHACEQSTMYRLQLCRRELESLLSKEFGYVSCCNVRLHRILFNSHTHITLLIIAVYPLLCGGYIDLSFDVLLGCFQQIF